MDDERVGERLEYFLPVDHRTLFFSLSLDESSVG